MCHFLAIPPVRSVTLAQTPDVPIVLALESPSCLRAPPRTFPQLHALSGAYCTHTPKKTRRTPSAHNLDARGLCGLMTSWRDDRIVQTDLRTLLRCILATRSTERALLRPASHIGRLGFLCSAVSGLFCASITRGVQTQIPGAIAHVKVIRDLAPRWSDLRSSLAAGMLRPRPPRAMRAGPCMTSPTSTRVTSTSGQSVYVCACKRRACVCGCV